MKTFREFIVEAYLIERGQPTFSSRAELEKHHKGIPSGMVANNAASTENPKWRLVTAANRKAQSERRAENLKPITHKEILSAVKRDLSIPNSEVRSVATKAYNKEVSAKGTQTRTRNTLRKETGEKYEIDHIVPQPDRRSEARRSRFKAIHPGDASANREVSDGVANRKKNSKNTRTTLTRSGAVRKALNRVK